MRFLRSPELAFWTLAVAALAALAVFAATRGGQAVAGGEPTVAIGAVGATSSQSREQVDNLIALMPSGIAAGTDPAALARFGSAVAAQSQQGATIRRGEAAADTDALVRGFERAHADATRLVQRSADPVAAVALRTQVGLDVQHLRSLVLGLPAPELPAAGLDPLGAAGGPTPPPLPQAPAAPTLPEKK